MSDGPTHDEDPKRWRRIEQILEQVMDLPPTEREVHLKRACAGDLELRQSVEALLSAEANADGFLRSRQRANDEATAAMTGDPDFVMELVQAR